MMPGWYCSGVMLQSDQFWRFFRTSVRRRATCASNFDGDPYIDSGIGRPGSFDEGAISSGAACAPAAAIAPPPAKAAVLRRKFRRPGKGSLSFDISSSSRNCPYYILSRMGKLAERYADATKSGVYRVTSAEIPLEAAVEANARVVDLGADGIQSLAEQLRQMIARNERRPHVLLIRERSPSLFADLD